MRRLKRLWPQSTINKIAIILAVLFLIVVVGGYTGSWYFSWTGLADYTRPPGVDERGKTLWNWLELLIIPAVLAGGAMWFSRAERKAEREIADDRLREAALQAYLDRMTDLLLKENLRTSAEDDEVRAVARARTLTTLRQLDGTRKGTLLQFLSEAGLIERGEHIPDDWRQGGGKRKAIINLQEADLSNAHLNGALMNSVDLTRVNLERSELREIRLSLAELYGANLRKADLRNANLRGADLRGVDFTEADLRGADLSSSHKNSGTNFAKAKLKGAREIGTEGPLAEADL